MLSQKLTGLLDAIIDPVGNGFGIPGRDIKPDA